MCLPIYVKYQDSKGSQEANIYKYINETRKVADYGVFEFLFIIPVMSRKKILTL